MKIVKWLDEHLEEALLIALLVVMCLLTGLQVFMRKVLNNSLTWSEELNRFCYIWSGFLSIGYCIKKGTEIRIDMAVNALPKKLRAVVDLAASLLVIALFALFAQGSVTILREVLQSAQTSSAMGLPMKYVYSAPLAGFGLGILRMVQHMLKTALTLGRPEPKKGGAA